MSQGLIPSKGGTFLFDVTSRAGFTCRAHTASYGTAVDTPVHEPGSNAIVQYTLYFRTMYKS